MLEFVYFCQIDVPLEMVRSFFNSPTNLLKITPMSFLMKVEPEREVEEGLRINLKLLGFTLMTSLIKDITPFGFTDLALRKPFPVKYWEHKHLLVPKGRLTIIEDYLKIDSSIPKPLIRLLLRLIFSYRCKRIKKLLTPKVDKASLFFLKNKVK